MATFGKLTDGTTNANSTNDKCRVSRFTPSTSGIATKLTARVWASSGSFHAKGIIYADNAGVPGALLAVSDEVLVSNTSEQEVDFPLSGANQINVSGGTYYWIGLALEGGSVTHYISKDETADQRRDCNVYDYDIGPDDPYGASTLWSGPIDVYVTYTEGYFLSVDTAALTLTANPVKLNHTSNPSPGRHEVFELTMKHSGSYSNPYTECSVDVTFTGQSGDALGDSITVKGFWDGGSTWKVRFAPPHTGGYSYLSSSSDAGLDDVAGSITVGTSSKKGRVIVDPSYPLYFKMSEGERYLLIGDTWWRHCYDSGADGSGLHFDDTTFATGLSARLSQGFNYAHITIWRNNTTDKLHNELHFTSNDPDLLNPAYFRWVDDRVQACAADEFIISFILGWTDNSFYSQFSTAQRERFAQYVINRYGCYPVIWMCIGEYNEYGTSTDWEHIADYFDDNDPYNNLVTIHPNIGFSEIAVSHLDYYTTQKNTDHFITAVAKRSNGMPFINAEFGYEGDQTAEEVLKDAWELMLGGSAGLVYGNREWWAEDDETVLGSDGALYMSYLADFWNSVQYWKFDSFTDLTGGRWEAKKNAVEHVYWTEVTGQFNINLSDMSAFVNAKWYNTKTGIWGSNFVLESGASVAVTPPDAFYALFIEPSYSIAIDTAELTLTANAVGLKADRKLAVDTAALSLTANPVNLKVGRKLSVDTAALTLAAQPVGLAYGRNIIVDTAALSLTAQPVGLKADRKLSVDTASLTLTASDVLLYYGYNLTVDTAALSLTANPVGLKADRKLSIDTAALTLAAQPVGLTYSRKIVFDTAALSLTAQPVGLKADRKLSVDTASLSLAANPVGLRAGRKIIVDTALLTLTANDVLLEYYALPLELILQSDVATELILRSRVG